MFGYVSGWAANKLDRYISRFHDAQPDKVFKYFNLWDQTILEQR